MNIKYVYVVIVCGFIGITFCGAYETKEEAVNVAQNERKVCEGKCVLDAYVEKVPIGTAVGGEAVWESWSDAE